MNKLLNVSGSPHVHSGETVQKIMWSVVLALVPAFLVSVFYFGLPVIVLTFVSVGCCVLFEYLIQRFLMKVKPTISDGSAVVTGLLLAFNVPANLPIWIMVVGAIVAIGIAKMPFGGLGHNPFNPALVARVFLLIAFPVAMTSWPVPTPVWGFADAVTGPTPLGLLKESASLDMSQMPSYTNLLVGQMGGSFGEVSAIALLIGAAFLLWKRIISWHIPVAFMLTVFVFSGIFWLIDPTHYASPFFHLLTGGIVLGACFMATDMVTSPTSHSGMLVFGCGCGLLTIIIRLFGAYPEGVSFSILIMNALVPLINKGFKPKTYAK
ncbi:MAG: RnfABCDGE type electron transport complex subunit D [Bacteroidales bacterium]|jgi:electron transport complex protein RnfD|nr:RnfABCDGE type electron transport complex subunit D [Bacteroidales bacterium]